MAQSPYFSGHGGQHSPLPPGAAQMITASNSMMAQGIKSLADQIGGALKERAKRAKLKKKEGDLSRSFLSLAFDRAESDPSFKMPTITDAEGNAMDVTKEEIPNLTYDQAVPAAAALQQYAEFSAQLAKTGLTGAQAETEGKRPDQIEAQTGYIGDQAAGVRASTVTEGHRPAVLDAQAQATAAGARLTDAKTATEAKMPDYMQSRTDLLGAQESGVKANTYLTEANAQKMWAAAAGEGTRQYWQNELTETTIKKMTADMKTAARGEFKADRTNDGKRILFNSKSPTTGDEMRQLFNDVANQAGPDADYEQLVKLNNLMVEGRKNLTDWTPSAVVVKDKNGKEHTMLFTSAGSAMPAPKGKGYNEKGDLEDEAIPGSKGKRRGIFDEETGTWRNVYSVDRYSLVTGEADIKVINDKLEIAQTNLAALKAGKTKGWKKANYNDNPANESYPDVVAGEGGMTFGNQDIDVAIDQEQARVDEYRRQLGGGNAQGGAADEDEIRQQAQRAIDNGADPAAVKRRLKEDHGIDL